MDTKTVMELGEQIGFEHFGELNLSALIFRPEVRNMCARDRCERYGTSWSCPPRVGDLALITERASRFSKGVIVQTTVQMEDSFDLESIARCEKLHKDRFGTLVRQLKMEQADMLPMASGTCTLCRKCTYPSRPCRHPDRVFPSMEAYGLLVRDVCEKSGLSYNYGNRMMTFTSLVLFN